MTNQSRIDATFGPLEDWQKVMVLYFVAGFCQSDPKFWEAVEIGSRLFKPPPE